MCLSDKLLFLMLLFWGSYFENQLCKLREGDTQEGKLFSTILGEMATLGLFQGSARTGGRVWCPDYISLGAPSRKCAHRWLTFQDRVLHLMAEGRQSLKENTPSLSDTA